MSHHRYSFPSAELDDYKAKLNNAMGCFVDLAQPNVPPETRAQIAMDGLRDLRSVFQSLSWEGTKEAGE